MDFLCHELDADLGVFMLFLPFPVANFKEVSENSEKLQGRVKK